MSTTTTQPVTRERPTIFTGESVRAILDGRKTQTRRTANIIWDTSRHWGDYDCWTFRRGRGNKPFIGFSTSNRGQESFIAHCPYGRVGDRLWVKETYSDPFHLDLKARRFTGFYRASDLDRKVRWRNALFMPRWASRITLEITGVRIERVQDISDSDVFAEGLRGGHVIPPEYPNNLQGAFANHWDTINGKRAPWASNPWVWALTFKMVRPAPA